MVDSVNNNSSNSLLRAQQLAHTQSLRNAQQPTTITQQKAAAVVAVKTTSVVQAPKLANSQQTNLPRGSIVDRLV